MLRVQEVAQPDAELELCAVKLRKLIGELCIGVTGFVLLARHCSRAAETRSVWTPLDRGNRGVPWLEVRGATNLSAAGEALEWPAMGPLHVCT